MTDTRHPMIDGADAGWIATQTRRPVAPLDAAHADFLARTVADGRRPILISGSQTRLTQPLWNALRSVGGAWVVQTTEGYHDAATGTIVDSPAEALTLPRAVEGDVYLDYLLRPLETRLHLVATVATRHRVRRPLRLGGPAEALVEALTGSPPRAWGATEPITASWDRDALSETSRRRMPSDSLWCFRGRPDAPIIGTIRVARTSEGVEETTHLWADISGPGSERSARLTDETMTALRSAAGHGMPLLALALAHVGAPGLERLPLLPVTPEPLALLVGPPGVRAAGIELREWTSGFDAETLGSPRLPSVLMRLGSTDGGGWARLATLIERLGPDRARELLSIAPPVGTQLDDGPRRDATTGGVHG